MIMPEPLRSWRTIDAVTMGPIPRLMMLPKLAPRMTERNSNRWSSFAPRPKRGSAPRTKNRMRMTSVHLSFSLKDSFFCVGPATSGKNARMFWSTGILLLCISLCAGGSMHCAAERFYFFYGAG